MSYLDVTPMMVALRTTPEEFELTHGWLHHVPSRHSFRFNPDGHVQISTACECALLAIRPEQERELASSFRNWNATYWRPLLINREFASHFRPRSMVRRMLIAATVRMHAWLVRGAGAVPAAVVTQPP